MKLVFKFLLFLFLFTFNVLANNYPSEEKKFYKKEIEKFLLVSKNYINLPIQQAEDTLKFKAAIKKLENFFLSYPNSKFSFDISFMLTAVKFIDAISAQEEIMAKELIGEMKAVIDKYQGCQLDTITKEAAFLILNRQFFSALMALPYDKIINYMNGWWGWQFKDYKLVIDNYSDLKNGLDFNLDKYGLLSQDIYTTLVKSYEIVGEKQKALNIANEARKKFPDNRALRKFMKNFIDRINL